MEPNRARETEILCRCCSGSFEATTDCQRDAVAPDWESLLKAATTHGVLPQLEPCVRECFDPPESVRSTLQQRIRRNALHNLRLTDELLDMLSRFYEHGIEAVPFKGPVLSTLVYDEVDDRQFVDLDVLVREDDALDAKRVLVDEGYEHEFDVDTFQERAFVSKRHVFEFRHPDRGIKIELHWRLTPRNVPFSFEYERLWRDVQERQFLGRDVSVLSPEDRLLYLCVHGSWHGWSALKWVNDVAAVVDDGAIDWHETVTRARERGGERMLLLGLSLAQSLFGTSLPASLESATTKDPIPSLTTEVERNLSAGELDRHAGSAIVDFRCRVCERRFDRLAYRLRLATMPMPADFERWQLPRWGAGLYHVLRPLSLLVRKCSSHGTVDR